ncbi:MAG: DUF6495 family protein [Crocinitomicaceae bacterium]
MKYRLLNKEEMEIFDQDFKHFLIANGVSNEEWVELNQKNISKATQLVELFSDTIFQKVYEKIQFIEFRSAESCIVFNCLPDSIELISINRKSDQIDLSTPDSIHEALTKNSSEINYFKSSKKYNTLRELEIHQMIENGCFNSSEDFWNSLTQLFN